MSKNSQTSIETSAPQQTGGFIIKHYFGFSNITRADKKGFLLAHSQMICVQSCFTVPRYVFLIGFHISSSKIEILNKI